MEPKLSFTIPSIHDETTLDCRLHYSVCYESASNKYQARGAIIAHPYAPLGGCYDDPVVSQVVAEILKQSYGFVCTFNFRGAFGSAGHTSWTGKAERADYESVVGFMIQFLRQCEPPTSAASNIFGTQSALPVQLILGGYSYGSWICSHVSDHTLVRKLFEVAPEGSAAAEIMARAQHLAAQTNQEILAAWRETSPRHSSHTHTIGGEETSPERRQRGGEDSPKRFSSDIRKSIDFAKRLGSVRKHYETPGATPEAQDSRTPEHARVGPNVVSDHRVEIAYLLVSPLLPPISAFTTLPFGLNALRAHSEETLQKFSANSSLAIFGSDDMFTSGRKLRSWAQAIGNRPSSQFRFVEVEGAGHFWRSHLVQKSLKIAIREWIQSLEGTPGVIGPESDNVDGS